MRIRRAVLLFQIRQANNGRHHDRKAAMNSTKVRALCCECGSLRTVSARYTYARTSDPTTRVADDGRDSRGWRALITLKCQHCKELTFHAQIRDDLSPDDLSDLETRLRAHPLDFSIRCGRCPQDARFGIWTSHGAGGCRDDSGFRCALHAAEILDHWERGLGGFLRCGCRVDELEEHLRMMPL